MMMQSLQKGYDSVKVDRIHNFNASRFFRSLRWAFLLILIFAQTTLGSKVDKQLLDAGEILLTRGQYLESIGLLHEIAAHTQNDDIKATAMLLIARAEHTYLDNPDAALKRFTQIMKQFPGTSAASKALFQTGILLFDKQAYQQSITAFSRYITKYPTGKHRKAAEVWLQIAGPLQKKQKKGRSLIQIPKAAPAKPCKKIPVVRVLIKQAAPRTDHPVGITYPGYRPCYRPAGCIPAGGRFSSQRETTFCGSTGRHFPNGNIV